jgi:hypothetical protein
MFFNASDWRRGTNGTHVLQRRDASLKATLLFIVIYYCILNHTDALWNTLYNGGYTSVTPPYPRETGMMSTTGHKQGSASLV